MVDDDSRRPGGSWLVSHERLEPKSHDITQLLDLIFMEFYKGSELMECPNTVSNISVGEWIRPTRLDLRERKFRWNKNLRIWRLHVFWIDNICLKV